MVLTIAADRDQEARFAELLERHRGIVFKVTNAYCRNSADREDLAQEIAAQLWRAFPSFDPERAFSTWMYRIALNVAISFVRTNSMGERHTVSLEEDHDVTDPNSPDLEGDDRVKVLYRFIDQLDALNRALLLLYLDERSHREIADVLNLGAYKELKLDHIRTSLRPLVWEHAGQVAFGLLLAFFVGPFWWRHLDQPNLFVSGVLLHAYAVAMIALGARVLVLIHTLDLSLPVLEIQKQLARLRRSYVRTGLAVGLPWWLLWVPLVMVVSGFDIVAGAPAVWLVANAIVGVVGILATLWHFRVLWNRSADPERVRKLENAAAGKSMRTAQRFLDEIAQFERE
jgi:RNA polymerase sigma-70 factor, ECF subfamily